MSAQNLFGNENELATLDAEVADLDVSDTDEDGLVITTTVLTPPVVTITLSIYFAC